MSESPRLSLWALLSAHDSNIYRAYTKQLVGGGWVGTFEPHVTLLESLTGEVVEREAFEATAAATLPFSIELTGLADYGCLLSLCRRCRQPERRYCQPSLGIGATPRARQQ